MIKLCVGCDTVEELLDWRRANADEEPVWTLRTRQTPKRAAELVDGGSLYRVYRGFILSRQRILAVDTLGEGIAARCHVTLDPDVVLTAPTPRRAFQGWRYLTVAEAPPDLGPANASDQPMPADLARQLRELGAW
jgi:hypothetical protein